MPRRLKLMADYQCYPLWDYGESGDEYECRDPAELSLTAEMVAALKAWAAWFDSWEMPHSRDIPPEEAEAFNRAGRGLWETLRRELGPGWQVVYYENGKILEPD